MREPVYYPVATTLGEIRVYAADGRPLFVTLPGCGEGGEEAETPAPAAVADLIAAVEAFFRGEEIAARCASELIAGLGTTSFERAVLEEVSRIPRGETRSYGEVAELAGYPRAARAVGNVMHGNPYPIVVPCHRVIRGDGGLGGYGGAEEIKAWLLRFESADTST